MRTYEDLIVRQEAVEALVKICDAECPYNKAEGACKTCILGGAFDAIEDLPLIDPNPVDPDDYY